MAHARPVQPSWCPPPSVGGEHRNLLGSAARHALCTLPVARTGSLCLLQEDDTMSQTQGRWVIASISSGEIAPDTARYASRDQAGQVLRDLVQQGRLEEGSW